LFLDKFWDTLVSRDYETNFLEEKFMKKLFVSFFIAMIAVLLVFVSCTPRAGTGAAPEGTLVVIVPTFPVTLDNTRTNDFNSNLVNRNWVETLVNFDGPEWNIVPSLAESWHFVDAQTVVFNLRRGVRFHNGNEMRASDVAFSIMRGVYSPAVRFILNPIESVDVIDDYTVQVNLHFPFTPILSHLTHPGAGITCEMTVRELGDDFANGPIGTGPFKFDSMSLGEHVELVRFEDYWGSPAGVERIRVNVVPEAANRLIEIETGAGHIAFDISPHHFPRLRDDPNLEYDRVPIPRIHFLGFNLQTTNALPLRDVRVRQAIHHAIDVQAIVETVYQGIGLRAYGPMVGIPGAIDFPPYEFDLVRARQLMAEAGYPNGFSATLWNTVANQQEVDKSVIIQNMLAQININVEIVSLEFATFLSGVTAGRQDMHVLTWNNLMSDPDYGLILFHSSNIGGSNRFRYSSPEVDSLLDRGRAELDPAARLEIYREAQHIIRNDMPAVFMLYGEELVALSPNINGFANFPIRSPRFKTVSFN